MYVDYLKHNKSCIVGFKICLELGMLAHTFSPSIQEAEAGGLKANLIY